MKQRVHSLLLRIGFDPLCATSVIGPKEGYLVTEIGVDLWAATLIRFVQRNPKNRESQSGSLGFEEIRLISVGRTDCLLQRRDLSSGSVRRSSEDPNLLLVTAWENQSRGQKSEDFSRVRCLNRRWSPVSLLEVAVSGGER